MTNSKLIVRLKDKPDMYIYDFRTIYEKYHPIQCYKELIIHTKTDVISIPTYIIDSVEIIYE